MRAKWARNGMNPGQAGLVTSIAIGPGKTYSSAVYLAVAKASTHSSAHRADRVAQVEPAWSDLLTSRLGYFVITPQAIRSPAFPVGSVVMSSAFAWITIAVPASVNSVWWPGSSDALAAVT